MSVFRASTTEPSGRGGRRFGALQEEQVYVPERHDDI